MDITKYYLIYYYHDCHFNEFIRDYELYEYLRKLKEEYKNDNDFHYKIIIGQEVLDKDNLLILDKENKW